MSALEARLAAIEARLAAVEARLAAGRGGGSANGASNGAGAVASDADLDSEYGDEVIKKDPKKWIENGGESYVGCRMSECPPEYLRMLASLFDWMASKDEASGKTYTNKQGKEVPVAPINRRKAAKARGWAKRNESKVAAPRQPSLETELEAADDDIPF